GADRFVALLADDEELALERIGIGAIGAARDEELADDRLDRANAVAEHAAVAGHVAPAEQALSFRGHVMRDRFLARGARLGIARQEHHADAIAAGLRQGEAETLRFLAEQ